MHLYVNIFTFTCETQASRRSKPDRRYTHRRSLAKLILARNAQPKYYQQSRARVFKFQTIPSAINKKKTKCNIYIYLYVIKLVLSVKKSDELT